jgi:hypothetical protein
MKGLERYLRSARSPNSRRARTDRGGSLPPSVTGIDPSGFVAEMARRLHGSGFSLPA